MRLTWKYTSGHIREAARESDHHWQAANAHVKGCYCKPHSQLAARDPQNSALFQLRQYLFGNPNDERLYNVVESIRSIVLIQLAGLEDTLTQENIE